MLTDVTISESIHMIPECSFYECSALDNISIPDSVYEIHTNAFSLTGLKSIELSANVSNIDSRVFDGCVFMKRIDVDPLNSTYASRQGVLFNKSVTELICYPAGKPG